MYSYGTTGTLNPHGHRVGMPRKKATKEDKKLCYFFASTIRVDNLEYPDHHDIKKLFLTGFKHYQVKNYVFQLENGDQEGNKHYQCYLHVGTRTRSQTLWRLYNSLTANDDRYLGGHFAPCSRAGINALKDYVMKEDTRIAGPWGLKQVYTGKDVAIVGSSPLPWQITLNKIMESEPDDRTITWITNSSGNVGKSSFVKYHCFKSSKSTRSLFCRVPFGTATQIKTFIYKFGASRTFFIDVPRTLGTKSEHFSDLMSALEDLKNGFISTPMYGKCQELYFDPPHVICFSNGPPPREMMSNDRWAVWHITSKTDTFCSKCNAGDCYNAGKPKTMLKKHYPRAFR